VNVVRDLIELLFVVAIGGMAVSSIRRIKAAAIHPYLCSACERPTARGYAKCRHCGAPVEE
jgi:ribosomal protein L37AE/L43A